MKVLVTGGTRGIGRAIAETFAKDGHDVVVTGTSENSTVPKRCRYIACDFTDDGQVQDLIHKVTGLKLSVLVNNAGINQVGSVVQCRLQDFSRIQRVNVTVPFLLCKAVVPGMCRRRFGRIVNITSIFSLVSKAGRSAYSASKCALFGLSRALALEVVANNVLVNCVAPGFVDTDLTRRILGRKGLNQISKQIPMGRLARPAEIARWVQFLASRENSYMTGQNLVVDGGFTSG